MNQGEFHHFAGGTGRTSQFSPHFLACLAKTVNRQRPIHLNTPDASGKRGVPAGYTYLFQLVGHDLTQTSNAPQGGADDPIWPVNLRRIGLELETVFGGGPIGCPMAYQVKGERNTRERTELLRVGEFRATGKKSHTIKDGDFARAYYGGAPKGNHGCPVLDEALIPDVRNDDNVILAQLTVKFHKLYNRLAETALEKLPGDAAKAGNIARVATVQIYRRIIRDDLLEKILHPAIYERGEAFAKLKNHGIEHGSVALEFAFGACRIAHSMVRGKYVLNDELAPISLTKLLDHSSQGNPMLTPIRDDWEVDWDLFFLKTDAAAPDNFNWAQRFGLELARGMLTPTAGMSPDFEGGPKAGTDGTLFRDLLRERSGALMSVNDLLTKIDTFPGDLKGLVQAEMKKLDVQDVMKIALEGILQDGEGPQIMQADPERVLYSDPPLTLYLLCEAQVLGDEGRTIGPLGSFIIAHEMRRVFGSEGSNPIEKAAAKLEQITFNATINSMPMMMMMMMMRFI
ncbi:hypothetical protein [Tateyamaria sp. SN3-11]|uniref:hypothetical protein n=1 Tax=Tateyamaria sp. SN3-11 TaxID=3092147 RepID=UPI0039EA503E